MSDLVLEAVVSVLPGASEVPPDVPLSDLGLDSIAVVRLVRSIERSCQVSIPRDAITLQNFSTVDSLRTLVGSLR